MRRFGLWLGRAMVALGVLLAGLWLLLPPEGVARTTIFDPASLLSDLDIYLAQQEATHPGITPGAEKRILWAGAKGAKTKIALVYLHGFSATSQEIRPVPDAVAHALGANLYFARLTGHGLTGADLATATAGDWLNDLDEALAIGRQIGSTTILIGTSTGGTLAAIAATAPDAASQIKGIVFISPNFRLQPTASIILDMPAARLWGPLIAGQTRSFPPQNEIHARYWTTSYPTLALFPMAALVRHARALAYGTTKVPALFIFSDADQVVSPKETARIAAQWGGPVTLWKPVMGPGDDPYSHVIAGDALSPAQTQPTVRAILNWARAL